MNAIYNALRGRQSPSRLLAYVVLMAYLVVFGRSVIAAGQAYVDPSLLTPPSATHEITRTLKMLMVIAGVLVVLYVAGFGKLRARQIKRLASGARSPKLLIVLAGAVMLAMFVSMAITQGLGARGHPSADVPLWAEALSSAQAAVGEEVILVAGVAAMGVMWRWPPWAIYLVALLARLSIHVYYGWSAIALLIWASGAIYIYLRTYSLLALIIPHFMFDLAIGFLNTGHGNLADLTLVTPIAVAVGVLWWDTWRRHGTRQPVLLAPAYPTPRGAGRANPSGR